MKKLLLIIAVLMVIPAAMTAQTAKTRQGKGAPSKLSTTTAIGDVNGDGDVNVTDVTLLVGHILGNENSNFIIENADVNGDGDITVTDVTKLVGNILKGNGGDDDEEQLELSATTLYMTIRPSGGCQKTVNILYGSGNYTATSSNNSVVTAKIIDSSVELTTQNKGEATIKVIDTNSGKTATFQVIVVQAYYTCPDNHHPHIIDIGTPDCLWACCNVGASSPEEYGGYYAWGETETKAYYDTSNYLYFIGFHDNSGDYICQNIGNYNYEHEWYDIAGTEYDVAHVKWGGSWVMPSETQLYKICSESDYVTWRWTSKNGVEGIQITSRTNDGSIFLPAAGTRFASGLDYAGAMGHYYGSVSYADSEYPQYGHCCATSLAFVPTICITDGGYRADGQTVRPVWIP
ncbi:MAG: dockerin type I repeat-containing protein [Prevotella sp.]|nr:dockerin type I repeat-containing protein [Prevotella sp.]